VVVGIDASRLLASRLAACQMRLLIRHASDIRGYSSMYSFFLQQQVISIFSATTERHRPAITSPIDLSASTSYRSAVIFCTCFLLSEVSLFKFFLKCGLNYGRG
jgi:hypothetical protein